jgi:hypothetical protein
VSSTPVPAPSSGGSSALKIILIVLAVLAAIMVGGISLVAYGCYHVAHSIVQKHGDKTSFSIPGAGTITADNSKTFTQDQLGAAIYPGSKAADSGSSLDLPSGSVTTAVFSTPDPVSKVEAFYKDKFGPDASSFGTEDTAMISKKISDNESVTVTASGKDNADGKTKIVIMHSKKK